MKIYSYRIERMIQILTLILLLPVVISYIVMLATYLSQSNDKQGMLFAIKLPAHAMEHAEIRRIRSRFHKQMIQIGVGMGLLLIPFVLLQAWFAFQLIYFFVWFILFFVVMVIPFRRAFRETLALKRANGWYTDQDDDEYWANGFTYHNPNDRRLFVEKRVGIGLTVNTGTLGGKIIMGCILALFAAVVLGVSFMVIVSEFTAPTLTITPDRHVKIDYLFYPYDFAVADIEQLALVDEVPSGVKTNGEATDQSARGDFRLDGLGKSRLYIFKNNPPYIQIKLADVYIFYNEKDPVLTRRLFEQLQELSGDH